jgi:hypothetical protein
MEEDSVWRSHVNGIKAITNQLGEICEEYIREGGVHGDDVSSCFPGKSMCQLERFTLVVISAVFEVWYFFNFLWKWKELLGIDLFCEEGIEVWPSGTEQHVHVF